MKRYNKIKFSRLVNIFGAMQVCNTNCSQILGSQKMRKTCNNGSNFKVQDPF